MPVSIRFAFATLTLVAAIGCAQSGPGTIGAPTAPGALSGSLSVGPGADYDASGSWHQVVTPRNYGGEVEESDVLVTQDADGNLHIVDEDGLAVTLTRLGPGNGRVISYSISAGFEASPCNVALSGTTTIDTQTNTGRGSSVFTDADCSRSTQTVIITKN